MQNIKDLADDRAVLEPSPSLEYEPAEYLSDLDGMDLTDEQKAELLQVLWEIMRSFVEMSVDIARVDPCGQLFGDNAPAVQRAHINVKSSFETATETADSATSQNHP